VNCVELCFSLIKLDLLRFSPTFVAIVARFARIQKSFAYKIIELFGFLWLVSSAIGTIADTADVMKRISAIPYISYETLFDFSNFQLPLLGLNK